MLRLVAGFIKLPTLSAGDSESVSSEEHENSAELLAKKMSVAASFSGGEDVNEDMKEDKQRQEKN